MYKHEERNQGMEQREGKTYHVDFLIRRATDTVGIATYLNIKVRFAAQHLLERED